MQGNIPNCNTSLTNTYEDICIIFQTVQEQKYELSVCDAMKGLITMKTRHMTACWTCFMSKSSIVVVESDFKESTCKLIWSEIRKHYDKLKPQKPKSITEIRNRITPVIEEYIRNETRNLGEVKRVNGNRVPMEPPPKWSAYFKPHNVMKGTVKQVSNEEFNNLCYELALHVETGINFL